ncbi:MAG: class I SAM-dependent methyltransferase [Saprospiraceae bacterium]|nr:class I SAM-dependent methyltransferase [Saprospiraceae bacterium]
MRSSTIYREHSPFFYDLWREVLIANVPRNISERLESVRTKLVSDPTEFMRQDFGTGNSLNKGKTLIKQEARKSLSSKWKVRILFRLIRHYQCRRVIELGTNLGLSSAYMASANSNGHIFTLEGDPFLCQKAKSIHDELGLSNINIIEGRFEDTIADVLRRQGPFDLIFLDGNHDERATIKYFQNIKNHIHEETILVIDDVFWSEGMLRAWEGIKEFPGVTASLLYFDLGILFFSPRWSVPKHLEWVDRWMKPWTIIHAI